MHDRDGLIWYDGVLVPWRSATTHVLTHSLHYGLSVFEGVRVYATQRGPALFRLAEHTERLLGSAHVYGMPLPYDRDALMDAQVEAVRVNHLDGGYVRTLAFYGPEKIGVDPRGARVHVIVAAFAWGAYLGAGAAENGIRVKTSSFVRAPAHAAPPRAKVAAAYANSILARQEAAADGYDEALLLDVRGFVAEGSGENVFIVRRGVLHEPAPTSALAGITRDTVLTLAADLDLRVVTGDLTRDDVYLADEAFFCGTAAEIVPIVELDRRRVGTGRPGPITRRLQASFQAAAHGEAPRHRRWLTSITELLPQRTAHFTEAS
ncbi:MAG TPA: branched-chain amino acid transaminase [Polyangiaceae bacterium]|nr:branched-chain amino acid transaminase [Polyangiaceae bacterium]